MDETIQPDDATEPTPGSLGGVLSDEEVGALFTAMRSSDAEGGPDAGSSPASARAFVPRALESGTPELQRVIDRVHATLAIEAGIALGGLLRLPVSFELGPVALEAPADLMLGGDEVRLALLGADGQVFGELLLAAEVVRGLADRMLGGEGAIGTRGKPLTELEKRVSARPLEALGKAAAAVWQPWVTGAVRHAVDLEGRSRPPASPILAAPIRIEAGALKVTGTAAYDVGPLARATDSAPALVTPAGATIARRLAALPLRVGFQAGGFALTLEEFLHLSPGQAVVLGSAADLRLEVTVEHRARLRGRLVSDASGPRAIAIEEQITGST